MPILSGHRARYWFGKRVKQQPGAELGTDAEKRDGKVSQTHRWFSYEWWTGHHHQRAADGSFSTWDGTGKPATRSQWAKHTTNLGQRKAPADRGGRKAKTAAFRDYLAEREHTATKATNGYMVTPAGKAKHITGGDFFDPNTSRRPSRRYMSSELRSWMGDGDSPAEHGGNGGGLMSFTTWQRQTRQEQAA